MSSYKANHERSTQNMIGTCNVRARLVFYKANRGRVTKSMFETRNVQAMLAATRPTTSA